MKTKNNSIYVPNLVNCIVPPPARRSHEEFDDKLDVDGDGRRLSVLTKITKENKRTLKTRSC